MATYGTATYGAGTYGSRSGAGGPATGVNYGDGDYGGGTYGAPAEYTQQPNVYVAIKGPKGETLRLEGEGPFQGLTEAEQALAEELWPQLDFI